jgi:UDP-N-acetylmuramate dehydrogenase
MAASLAPLQTVFGERVLLNEPLARYTAARIGGPAKALFVVQSAAELAQAASLLWENAEPFILLGGGSNVLVSDRGISQVVLLNRSRHIRFAPEAEPPYVWAESGANTGVIARQAAQKGLGSFEWAAGIPGTLGGAVVGNAGAHGGDMAGNLRVAEILQHTGQREIWPVERLEYAYRSSLLKQYPGTGIVLSAEIGLAHRPVNEIEDMMNRYLAHRRRTQPPGASMGSMFKNPQGDYAGRLIEAAGLKGTRIGEAEISSLHGNFFLNLGQARASEVRQLIDLARATVAEKFGIELDLEIEYLGDW